uniref:Uncharacterized protein n=1 Tax=Podoviridae sp. ct2m58 TaxID=2827721 RepID=A0A8S5TMB3_9CAUD|nr:MAG TPA: hypothetical protein [Podoviridae sp. ct2m58]
MNKHFLYLTKKCLLTLSQYNPRASRSIDLYISIGIK